MPAWLDKQRAEQRRKSRDRRTVLGAGAAGAAGYEGYALARKPSWSVTRNTRVATQSSRRARNLAGQADIAGRDAANMTAPRPGTPERAAWEKGRRKATNPTVRYPKGFDPNAFRAKGKAGQTYAHGVTRSQARALGMTGAEYDAQRRVSSRLGPGILANDPSKTDKALSREGRAYYRTRAANLRGRYLNIWEHKSKLDRAQAGRSQQAQALGAARSQAARDAARLGNRARGLEQTSRYAAKGAFKGGARMGLAFAGASGTAAAGLAGMRAWEKRNAKKAASLPGATTNRWDQLSDAERRKAVGFGRTARPVGAIGTPGKKGVYA